MSANGRRQFTLDVRAALNSAAIANPNRFVAIAVLGSNPEDEGEALFQLIANVEEPQQFLLHIRDAIDNMLSGDCPIHDMRTEGNA
jgi:hypothetical protein